MFKSKINKICLIAFLLASGLFLKEPLLLTQGIEAIQEMQSNEESI